MTNRETLVRARFWSQVFFDVTANFQDNFIRPKLIGISDPNLDLLCVFQLNTASICENYANLYFDAEHLERDRIWGGEIFGTIFSKSVFFWPISDTTLIF